ncbi:phytochrome sensor signal transduction histidine kinase [Rhizobium sp. RU35A]|uniref:ATP-binding protein n=1 Tax=Rhizobium sp. RU35A TaxID=1907414 RepID=UPI000953F298|nr:ATP-binding protein [Rhizobium sp. RU35A]SIQ94661.1 phytochrome sensor signal transduction histidine kinase [Rhizobium sp. RU35A]
MNETDPDLEACAREPIRVPGAIQPHGALFVLAGTPPVVVQVSANLADYLPDGVRQDAPLFGPLADLGDRLVRWQASGERYFQTRLETEGLIASAHRAGDRVIVEVERLGGERLEAVFSRLRSFTAQLSDEPDIARSLPAVAGFVQQLTGFDRVLVYRFDADWNGQVVAESGNGRLPSYLDLRFPAADIPAQARALYATNRLRIIPDVDYRPVPLVPVPDPQTGDALDMSQCQLRSVSPVHLEYMRNMGTAASMSVSILVDGRLWGLISCHSAGPHMVSQALREICDFVAQALAMRIAALARAEDAARRLMLSAVTSRLLSAMSSAPDWMEALAGEGEGLLAQVGAAGAALVSPERLLSVGEVPPEAAIRRLAAWLDAQPRQDLFSTDRLTRLLEQAPELAADLAPEMAARASGVLALPISRLHAGWLIWFRPELLHTVRWGGNPHEKVREQGRIHPRQSFSAWQELVRARAEPWSEAELAAARALGSAIVGIVLRKAEELAELSGELTRANKELEAFSYSVSHDLRAPFRHIVGFAELLRERETGLDEKSRHYLQTISDAALSAGRLVDDLLNFSQLGRTALVTRPVDMDKLVAEVITSVTMAMGNRRIEWRVSPLPVGLGDATLLRQVWFNLIDNAVKYTRDCDPARIVIAGETRNDMALYSVTDNGVGFDMAYVGKLFGVFQRLQRAEDFEGTGIGLALARRIVERHNGSISAHGELGQGASFTFALPMTTERKGRALA